MRKPVLFLVLFLAMAAVILPLVSLTQITTGVQKLAAFKKQQQMLQHSPYKKLQWRLTGPDNRSGSSTDVVGITGNPNIIYAAFATGGFWKTEGGGNTWKLISPNLPASPVNVIIEDPDSANVLYCGTDMGVYISKNIGKSWIAINGNMPAAVAVDDMFIHPMDKKLVIATYGRGVYVFDDLSKLR